MVVISELAEATAQLRTIWRLCMCSSLELLTPNLSWDRGGCHTDGALSQLTRDSRHALPAGFTLEALFETSTHRSVELIFPIIPFLQECVLA